MATAAKPTALFLGPFAIADVVEAKAKEVEEKAQELCAIARVPLHVLSLRKNPGLEKQNRLHKADRNASKWIGW